MTKDKKMCIRDRLECEQRENKRQLKTYSVIIKNHIEQYEKYLDININAEKFADDILCLTDELNKQLEKKNELDVYKRQSY